MSLARINLIVAIDRSNGIAKDGQIPWNCEEDMKFFRSETIGRGRNVVIMGRNTYESIPKRFRPLAKRKNVVISRTMKQSENPDILVFSSLPEALLSLGSSSAHEEAWMCGGEGLYLETVRDYLYLVDRISVTRLKDDHQCTQFFPFDAIADLPQQQKAVSNRDFTRYTFFPAGDPRAKHPEMPYLALLSRVLAEGEKKPDRTGTGTISIFGAQLEFSLLGGKIPVLTTKKVITDAVIRELLFFISGKTDTRILEEQKVNIWKPNTRKEFLEKRGLSYDEGDAGPFYGYQYRHFGSPYEGCDADYRGKGIDQLAEVIESIRKNPHSRRHIVTAWNPSQLDEMVLPPCHMLFQFNVSGDGKYLDCMMTQRSADLFLGLPFNILSYGLLTHMVAHVTGLKPRKLVISIGDAHLYQNHLEQAKKQLSRDPYPHPTLTFRNGTRLHEIDDFSYDSFIFSAYQTHPMISAPMAT